MAAFGWAILPAWYHKSPRISEVLPLLYLHGLSSKDFGPALADSSARLRTPVEDVQA